MERSVRTGRSNGTPVEVAALRLVHWSATVACRGHRDLFAATGQLAAAATGVMLAAPATRRAAAHPGAIELAAVALLWAALALGVVWCAFYWRPDRNVALEEAGDRLAVARARSGDLRAALGVADVLADHQRVTSRLVPAERDIARRRARIVAAQVDRAAAAALEAGLIRLRGDALLAGTGAPAHVAVFWGLVRQRRDELAVLVADAEMSEGGALALAAHLEAELEVERCEPGRHFTMSTVVQPSQRSDPTPRLRA